MFSLRLLLKWVLIVPIALILTFVLAYTVDCLLAWMPSGIHWLRSPSAKSECQEIKPGMNLDAVQAIVNRTVVPAALYRSANRLFIERHYNVCEVEFDPNTLRVVTANFRKSEFRHAYF